MRGIRISVRARDFSLLQNDQNGSGATESLVEWVPAAGRLVLMRGMRGSVT